VWHKVVTVNEWCGRISQHPDKQCPTCNLVPMRQYSIDSGANPWLLGHGPIHLDFSINLLVTRHTGSPQTRSKQSLPTCYHSNLNPLVKFGYYSRGLCHGLFKSPRITKSLVVNPGLKSTLAS
jgi:hypothetical protein